MVYKIPSGCISTKIPGLLSCCMMRVVLGGEQPVPIASISHMLSLGVYQTFFQMQHSFFDQKMLAKFLIIRSMKEGIIALADTAQVES